MGQRTPSRALCGLGKNCMHIQTCVEVQVQITLGRGWAWVLGDIQRGAAVCGRSRGRTRPLAANSGCICWHLVSLGPISTPRSSRHQSLHTCVMFYSSASTAPTRLRSFQSSSLDACKLLVLYLPFSTAPSARLKCNITLGHRHLDPALGARRAAL